MTWVVHVAAKRISRFLKRKQNPARLTQDLQDNRLLSRIFGTKEGVEKRAGAMVNPKSSRASPRDDDPGTTTPARSGAALTLADVRVPQVPLGVLEVEGLALLAVASHGVVLAVVTNPPAGVPRGHVHGHVKVALGGVAVAIALCDNDKKHRLASGETRACRKGMPKSAEEHAELHGWSQIPQPTHSKTR